MKRKSALIILLILAMILLFALSACNKSGVQIFFQTNGGGEIAAVTVDSEGRVVMPPDPVRSGYTFDGWYFDDGTWNEPFKANEKIQRIHSFTLYAKWIKNGLSFTQINGSYAVTGFNGTESEIVIPYKYRNLPVTTIAKNAFFNTPTLFSVTVPTSITTINESAFDDCRFLTILCEASSKPSGWNATWNADNRPVVWNCANNAVADDGFTYFTGADNNRYGISDTVARFVRYTGTQTSVTLPSSVTYNGITKTITAISSFAFADKTALRSVTLPNTITSIGEWAFSNCANLSGVQIPSGVKSIGSCAFLGADSLTDILIPSSVDTIGAQVFDFCSAVVIYCQSAAKKPGWNEQWAANTDDTGDNPVNSRTNPVYFGISTSNFTTIDNMQFVVRNDKATISRYKGSASLVEIPSSVVVQGVTYEVTEVGDLAFAANRAVQRIVVPDSISTVGYASFANCINLSEINITANIVNIEARAYANCDALEEITIPASVTYISSDIFDGSDNVVINCEAGNMLGGWSFDWNYENGQPSERTVNWGVNNITTHSDYNYVIHNDKVYLTSFKGSAVDVDIPQTIENLDIVSFGNIFQGNTNLVNISIPESILRISDYAFYKCFSLTSVELPSNIISIGNYAFAGTEEEGESMSLAHVYLSYDIMLETIGASAFEYCTELESFNMPVNVYKIGERAFYKCVKLESIVLRNQVTQIGAHAFYNCDEITIYCEMAKNAVPVGWDALWNSTNETTYWEQETDQEFTVYTYYQNIYDDGYTLVRTETGIGAVGSRVSAIVRNISHFTYVSALSTTNGIVEMGGSLILSIYYNRKTYTVNFSGGQNASLVAGDEVQTIRYGADVIAPEYTRTGYHIDGWSNDLQNISQNISVQPVWAPDTNTPYKVYFYFENIDDEDFTQDEALTLNLTGTTDTTASASLHEFNHYTLNADLSVTSGNIAPDGSLVLALYYCANTYTVTFHANGGTLKSGEAEQQVKYRNGAQAPAFERQGYTRTGWSGTFSEITQDTDVYAIWEPNGDTPYKVEYYFENVADADFTIDELLTENRTGTTDLLLTLDFAPEFEHFVFDGENSVMSGTITGDGLLVLAIYYKRVRYTVVSGQTTQNVKYGAAATAPVFEKQGYTLSGWDKSLDNISENQTITALWEANTDTPYKIEYYFENIAGGGYTKNNLLTETLSGTTATNVSVGDISEFDHFEYNIELSTSEGTILADGSLVLALYYDREVYTVEFEGGGGDLVGFGADDAERQVRRGGDGSRLREAGLHAFGLG